MSAASAMGQAREMVSHDSLWGVSTKYEMRL